MKDTKTEQVVISAPNFKTAIFRVIGTAPLVMNKFSQKARQTMAAAQAQGTKSRKGQAKEGKDFDGLYEGAFHRSEEGWAGIPAASFRKAMISACRLVGFKMTIGKLSFFIESDGMDSDDGMPLIRIVGEPRRVEHYVRNATGVVDIRVRPQWPKWSVTVRVRFDADQFSEKDIANLLMRAGEQVGVGEGRPDSRMSAGMGWGTFSLAGK